MKKLILGAMALALISFSSCGDDDDGGGTVSIAEVNGGVLSGGPFEFTVGDGIADNLTGISLTGNTGANSIFVITNGDGTEVLGLPADLTALEAEDFDGAPAGECLVWHLSYEDGVDVPTVGSDASNLPDGYSLSNSIPFTRIAGTMSSGISGGTLVGDTFVFVVGDGIEDNISGISLEGNVGLSAYAVTNGNGLILTLAADLTALEAENFDATETGEFLVWHIAYEDDATAPIMGDNVNDLGEDYDLSNSIFFRKTEDAELKLDITSLENLGPDFTYEGWILVGGTPISTGIFTVDDAGALSEDTFSVNGADLVAATSFVLSIEPAVDMDPLPAETKLLVGDFTEGSDSVMVSSTGQVADFSAASAKYILATPTDSDDTNELSGIWFLDNSGVVNAPGLDLPELTSGWAYEGWVVINGTPVSTGTFTDGTVADDNASTSIYKGTLNDGPPYPGEDFVMGSFGDITFPTDLSGQTVVISVEPSPDNSTAPFTLKPLTGMIPTDVATGDLNELAVGAGASVSGTINIIR